MQQQEADIESLMHRIKHVPRLSLNVTADQQSEIYFASIPCTQREMSDDEVLEEMQDGLDDADALTLEDLKTATISQAIPTAIADSGASTTCVQPKEEQMQASECGKYTWDDPLSATNTKSDKVFQMARGDVAPGEDVVHLNALPLRRGAAEAHTVRGLTNSLISMSTLRKHGYIPIFEQDKMSVYDGLTTTITVSRKAVMEGWYCPKEKLWRIPLVKNVSNVQHQSIPVAMSPMQILQDGPPPPTDQILSAYELTTRPELIRYYHAAAGFPSKPTWVAAIKNGHYQSWTGLTAAAAAKYFPESMETWRGHGRKIRMNLRSTKTAIDDEDYYYHAGPLVPKHANEQGEESTRTPYHVKQCALSRVLEREAAMAFNEAPKGRDQEQEETYRYKTPTDEIFHKVYDLHDENERKMYTDQTGLFPTKSYKGMQCIMV